MARGDGVGEGIAGYRGDGMQGGTSFGLKWGMGCKIEREDAGTHGGEVERVGYGRKAGVGRCALLCVEKMLRSFSFNHGEKINPFQLL